VPEVKPSTDLAWNLLDWLCRCALIYGALFGIGKIVLNEVAAGALYLAIAALSGAIIIWDLTRRGWASIME
jgi:hypothetical protein